jgi:hypothetical protein
MRICPLLLLLGPASLSVAAAARPANGIIRLPHSNATDRVFLPATPGNETAHEWVGEIVQDDEGFLWFGTRDGLDQFDGYDYRHSPSEAGQSGSLDGTFVYALYKDHSGRDGPPRRLEPSLRDQVIRIGQEAITNADHHSHGPGPRVAGQGERKQSGASANSSPRRKTPVVRSGFIGASRPA